MDILFLSKRIFLGNGPDLVNGGVLVTNDGIIRTVFTTADQVNSFIYNHEAEQIIDFGNHVLMPGLIDSHVHINEPGRKDWEGFVTATKAAAAGGFTTIVDMPLHSIPPTTTVANLKSKMSVARGKIYVDVAFWGGLVPDNLNELEPMISSGVIGLKCSLDSTNVPEFSQVNEQQIEAALKKLENSETVLAFHAEVSPKKPLVPDETQRKKYQTFLSTRPSSMEVDAVEQICNLAQAHKVRMHIESLSAADALPIVQKCRKNGANISVETCHHYLSLCAEEVADGSTECKCSPPIRDKSNQDQLWKAVQNKDIDLISSAHSPVTPGLKCLTYGKKRGDFLNAWSGIASNQFGLSLFWTNCEQHNLRIEDVWRLMCLNPAKLCGIDHIKGKIAEGYHADFCVWDPDEEFIITPDIIYFQNKANPYMNWKVKGAVHATVVRGFHVFQRYESFGQPLGRVVLRKPTKKIVKFASN